MSYKRVIPRDFFNESKLLKCLGQLQLAIHDNQVGGLPLLVEFDDEPFQIEQDEFSGSLSVRNYAVYLDGERVELYTVYNSKDAYPLMAAYKGEEYYVFNSQGKFMPNFGWGIK